MQSGPRHRQDDDGPGWRRRSPWSGRPPTACAWSSPSRGRPGVQAYDGTTGWMHMPFMGKAEPERMAPKQARRHGQEQADLLDGSAGRLPGRRATRCALVGKKRDRGHRGLRPAVTMKNGDVVARLPRRRDLPHHQAGAQGTSRATRRSRSTPRSATTSEVGGLMLPHASAARQGRARRRPRPEPSPSTSYDFGAAIDDSALRLPRRAAADKPAATKPPGLSGSESGGRARPPSGGSDRGRGGRGGRPTRRMSRSSLRSVRRRLPMPASTSLASALPPSLPSRSPPAPLAPRAQDLHLRRPRRAPDRSGGDERPHRRPRRRCPATRSTICVGAASGGLWRSKDAGHHLQAGLRQAAGAVDRRHRPRPQRPQDASGWAPASRGCATASRSATASTSRPTAATAGSTSASPTDRAHRAHRRRPARTARRCWVCALGHLWNANEERGVFSTTDGGKTWEKVLYVDAGHRLRRPRARPAATRASPTPGCGSSAASPGPSAPAARAAASTARPTAARPGQRLDDGLPTGRRSGASRSPWRRRARASSTRSSRPKRRPRSTAPTTSATTWRRSANDSQRLVRARSTSRTWSSTRRTGSASTSPASPSRCRATAARRSPRPSAGFGGGVHGDLHALWIDPRNPHHLILGTDGGVYESHDRGGSWRHLRQPAGLAVLPRRATTCSARTTSTAGCRTTAPGWARRAAPGGVRNRALAQRRLRRRLLGLPRPQDGDIVYSEMQGGGLFRVAARPARSSRSRPSRQPARRSCASTGTRRSPAGAEAARSTSARSTCSARATGRVLGAHLARPDDQRPAEAEAARVGRPHRRQLDAPRTTPPSTPSPSRRRTRR